MRRERDKFEERGASLLFVYASEFERREAAGRLPVDVLTVGRRAVAEAVDAERHRREEAERPDLAALEEAVHGSRTACEATENQLTALVAEQRRLLDAADWCALQADQDIRDAAAIEEAVRALEELSGSVRAAKRRLDAVVEQRAAAEAALEEARSELAGLRAADDSDSSAQLESQITAVEHQLTTSEKAARAELEEQARALSRTELALERLRTTVRERRARLGDLLRLIPEDEGPGAEGDPVAHADRLGRSLRVVVDRMAGPIDDARSAAERSRSEAVELEQRLAERRAAIGVHRPVDETRAIECLARDRPALALDDVVVVGDAREPGVVAGESLLDVVTPTPVIVLTADTDVLSWAIELPADRASIASVRSVVDLGVRLTARITPNQTMEQRTC